MILLQQMIVLFIYMMIGYYCCKKDYLNIEASDKISWIVVNIANPGLLKFPQQTSSAHAR